MNTFPCISVRQPWAWLIVNGFKDIENRNWSTGRRGRVLIHASKGMTDLEWCNAALFARRVCGVPQADIDKAREDVAAQRGGIVGSVEIVDCVDGSRSPWFVGEHGFVLRNAKPLPFIPYKGALGFFRVPESAITP